MSKTTSSYLCDRCKHKGHPDCVLCDRGRFFVEREQHDIAYGLYCKADFQAAHDLKTRMSMTVKKVVFNDPATIVYWADGTKTVVKCQEGDTFDPEMGLAMAIAKKAMGNTGAYNKVFKKWLPKEKDDKPMVLGYVVGVEANSGGVVARIKFNDTKAAQKLKESIYGVRSSMSFYRNETAKELMDELFDGPGEPIRVREGE